MKEQILKHFNESNESLSDKTMDELKELLTNKWADADLSMVQGVMDLNIHSSLLSLAESAYYQYMIDVYIVQNPEVNSFERFWRIIFETFNYQQKVDPQTTFDILNLLLDAFITDKTKIEKIISDYNIEFKLLQ